MQTDLVTREPEATAKRNALICPCCLQFVEDSILLADPVTCQITNGEKQVKLTFQQFKLAKYLIDCFPLMATKEAIYDNVFMDMHGEGPGMKIMDIIICKVRPALADVGIAIETVWGKGYRLVAVDPSQALSLKESSIRARSPGTMRRWTKDHDEQLIDLIRRKMKVAACASIMKMPYMSVERHYKRLQALV